MITNSKVGSVWLTDSVRSGTDPGIWMWASLCWNVSLTVLELFQKIFFGSDWLGSMEVGVHMRVIVGHMEKWGVRWESDGEVGVRPLVTTLIWARTIEHGDEFHMEAVPFPKWEICQNVTTNGLILCMHIPKKSSRPLDSGWHSAELETHSNFKGYKEELKTKLGSGTTMQENQPAA